MDHVGNTMHCYKNGRNNKKIGLKWGRRLKGRAGESSIQLYEKRFFYSYVVAIKAG